MYTGPKLTNDNLVFGYDTGYGLDQHSSTRHYKGEPATNLITSGLPGYFGSGGETLYRSNYYGLNSDSGVFQRNFVNSPNVGNNAGLYKNFNTAALNSSTEYIQVSFDFYMITPYVRSGQAATGLNGYLRVQSTNGTFDNYGWDSRYSNGSGDDWNNNSAYIGKWQKVSLFVDVRDDTTPSAINAMYIYVDFATQGEGIYTNFIITEHTTLPTGPVFYTSGTRSDTASLIDLKKTTDIDVSNVSFDSTGQPTFDGTSDSILVGTVGNYSNTITVEAVFKTSSSASWKNILCGTSGDIIFTVNGSKLNFGSQGNSPIAHANYSTTDVNDGEWHYGVATYDGSQVKIYVDGVLESTNSRSGNQTPSSLRVGSNNAGASEFFNGDIPLVKLYNRVLTAAEITNNYNAYKNRFNI